MTAERPLVMLVDDEPDILVALQDLLEVDYRTAAFGSAADALETLRAGLDVCVIVSDQRMPGMTGDVFLAEARKLSDAGAILLTGYADLSAVTAALNGGGIVGYAPKPWEPEALKAMIASAAEQHRLRRSLRQEQALLRGLMEHLPYAVSVKDPDGRFVGLNARKASSLGRPLSACEGRTEAELGGVAITDAERRTLHERRPVQVVEERAGPKGPVWMQTDYVPLIGRDGAVENLVVMERDITDQRMAEQQLRQSEKLRALGTLAGGIAHDFNNLLTAIVGSLELAAKRVHEPARVRRYLDNATLAAQRGAALTQRLLGFSRRSDSRPTTVDVAAAMSGMRDILTRTLGAGIRLDWRVADGLWPTSVEPDQLEVGILNLAINARDAMPDGGGITVEARNVVLDEGAEAAEADLAPGEYVLLTIADTGEGMPPEVLERILEPFFTTKPVGKGTGLGLPMVYGFAQRSGGGLSIRSTPGEGTEVRLYLPRAREGMEPAGAAGAASWQAGPRARVLVLDDEPGVRAVTAASLRDLGHEVLEAQDGPAALRLLDAGETPDVVLVDFAMPGMNGLEFIAEARRRRPDLPAVLLTGYFDVEATPADMLVLHKPFTQAGLGAAVVTALNAELTPP